MIDAYKRHISSNAQLMTTMTVFYLFSHIIFIIVIVNTQQINSTSVLWNDDYYGRIVVNITASSD